MSSDLYCLSELVSVCSHFKVRWHVLIFLSMRIFFFVDPGSRKILEQIGGVVPMNGDESNYMSIMHRLESELSLPYFLASEVANFPVFIGLYLITPRCRFGYLIHIPKAKEYMSMSVL